MSISFEECHMNGTLVAALLHQFHASATPTTGVLLGRVETETTVEDSDERKTVHRAVISAFETLPHTSAVDVENFLGKVAALKEEGAAAVDGASKMQPMGWFVMRKHSSHVVSLLETHRTKMLRDECIDNALFLLVTDKTPEEGSLDTQYTVFGAPKHSHNATAVFQPLLLRISNLTDSSGDYALFKNMKSRAHFPALATANTVSTEAIKRSAEELDRAVNATLTKLSVSCKVVDTSYRTQVVPAREAVVAKQKVVVAMEEKLAVLRAEKARREALKEQQRLAAEAPRQMSHNLSDFLNSPARVARAASETAATPDTNPGSATKRHTDPAVDGWSTKLRVPLPVVATPSESEADCASVARTESCPVPLIKSPPMSAAQRAGTDTVGVVLDDFVAATTPSVADSTATKSPVVDSSTTAPSGSDVATGVASDASKDQPSPQQPSASEQPESPPKDAGVSTSGETTEKATCDEAASANTEAASVSSPSKGIVVPAPAPAPEAEAVVSTGDSEQSPVAANAEPDLSELL